MNRWIIIKLFMRFMFNDLTPIPSPKERGIEADIYYCVKGVLLIIFLFFFSCKKDKDTDDVIPKIEFVSLTPSTVIQNQDSITFTIKYSDGDGDLGENTPAAKNLFLTDNRIHIPTAYRISQLAPSGSSVAIQGTLNVVLKNTSLTDSSNQQTTTFSIYVVDRAGHQSNSVTSSVVTIKK